MKIKRKKNNCSFMLLVFKVDNINITMSNLKFIMPLMSYDFKIIKPILKSENKTERTLDFLILGFI